MSTFLYNPDRKPKANLIDEFVVRTEVFDEIMKDLGSSKMLYPEQHYLLIGQRGAGKTTLLHRIKYGVEDSQKLNNWLIPIIFSEEQYNISELVNLWENVGQYLEDYHDFAGIQEEMLNVSNKKNFEEICFDILEKRLKEKGKKILLLIDNIGDLLKKIGTIETRRLREILQTKNTIRLIAGSPFYLESILDYHQPLFEFFKVIRLDSLTLNETINLLLKLGEVYNETKKIEFIIKETPQRIETMRALTGGVPRTIVLLFQIFVDEAHQGSVKDLYKILDLVTPLYKHRMDELPKQQQKIVDVVAKNWEPITVKELTEKIRLESKLISAQLRQLEKEQIIQKNNTATKNKSYLLKDRFWNIWYLMRYGKKDDKQKVIWLVKFLESWLTDDEINRRIDDFVSKVKDEKIEDTQIDLLAKTYISFSKLSLDNQLKLRSVQNRTEISVIIDEKEVSKRAQESFGESNYIECFKYLSNLSILSEEEKKMMRDIVYNTYKDKSRELFNKISSLMIDYSEISLQPCLHFAALYNLLLSISLTDEDALMGVISIIEKWILVVLRHAEHQIETAESNLDYELKIFVATIAEFIKKGYYFSILKVIEETKLVQGDNKYIFIKDVFKPLFLAVKHFNSLDEINNYPDELKSSSLSIVEKIKNQIQIS